MMYNNAVVREKVQEWTKLDSETLVKVHSEECSEDRELAITRLPPDFYDMVRRYQESLMRDKDKATKTDERFLYERTLAENRMTINGIIDKRLYKLMYYAAFKADTDARIDISGLTTEERELHDRLVPIFREYYNRMRSKCYSG